MPLLRRRLQFQFPIPFPYTGRYCCTTSIHRWEPLCSATSYLNQKTNPVQRNCQSFFSLISLVPSFSGRSLSQYCNLDGHRRFMTVSPRTSLPSSHSDCNPSVGLKFSPSRKLVPENTKSASRSSLVDFNFSDLATEGVSLTEEQINVLRAVKKGCSVFISGSAGTGKSFLLELIIRLLHRIHSPRSVFVTASTGVSALALGGLTIHSFSGIGECSDDSLEALIISVERKKHASKRWRRAKVLIIDEISMISGVLFDKLERIASTIRAGKPGRRGVLPKPWGGIQLIVTGDFFQLPPVDPLRLNLDKEFAFEADCWDSSFDLQVELTRVFRQTDAQLIELLQAIRKGRTDIDYFEMLKSRFVKYKSTDFDSSVTRLLPRNDDVNGVNEEWLIRLPGEKITYVALDVGKRPWMNRLKHVIAPPFLELCVGARVMLVKNIDPANGLANGTTGTVVGFEKSKGGVISRICDKQLLPKVLFDTTGIEKVIKPESWFVRDGQLEMAKRRQVPLILAWALSIHKCQGLTLDRLWTDLSNAFGCGMVYVALSRVRSLDGLYLSGFSPGKIKVHPKVLEYSKRFDE